MQIEYQRDLRDHYMVLHGSQQLPADSYQIHMIRENDLQGFTDCHTELVDEEIRYAYRITSMQSLEEMAALKPVGSAVLQNLFRAAADALEELERFLLPQDGMLLQPEFIFTDALQQSFRFCYFPENTVPVSDGMKGLSEFLLPHLDEKDRKGVMLGFSFYQICAAGEMTETKLKELLYAEMDSVKSEGPENREAGYRAGEAEQQLPAAAAYTQRELTGEELRARILDDFFSDEEEAEAAQKELSRRRLIWFLLMTVCALGTAAVLALNGWVQSGLGAGVLIEATAILLWRKRGILAMFRSRMRQRRRDGKTDEPDWYEEVDAAWQTYEERAEELERTEPEAAGAVPASASPEGAGRSANIPAERTSAFPAPVYSMAPASGGMPGTGYEETVWLGEDAAAGTQIIAWLEQSDEGRREHANASAAALSGSGTGGSREQRILLTEPEHLIGKNAEICDVIAASSAVSRMHARFVRQEKGYTVTDLRSRNGTFLNGAMLEAGRAYELKNGDSIRFADQTYQYCCTGGTERGLSD
ncbi:MAG: FHA domain-containing protein [Eubacterium sp.]|nr:FHA domain-containing protein [Eubacterium sp.]